MGRWLDEARRLLDRFEATQLDAVAAASEICAEAIGAGGLVHLFGAGHSRIPAEEMFPRYGSYPGFHPIGELSMTVPPASNNACRTSRRWSSAARPLPTSNPCQVPTPVIGNCSPVEGMGRVSTAALPAPSVRAVSYFVSA